MLEQHTDSVRGHLRGSSMLMTGRVFAMGVNLAVHLLIVRYLVREEYGAFAYALVMAELLANVFVMGLDKAVTRFAAIYHERLDYPRIMGAIVLAVAAIAVTSAIVIAIAFALRGSLAELMHAEPESITLLLILIFLAPAEAVDAMLTGLYGVFANPKAILFRKHLLGPGLRLLAVLLTIALGGTATMLAGAYVGAMAIGIAVYIVLFLHVLGRGGHLQRWRPRTFRFPVREIFGFGLVMLGSDLVFILYNSLVVFFLEFYHGVNDVAGFQAIRPFARLNHVVYMTFALLFFPVLSRFIARADRESIRVVHQRTGLWNTTLTFPVFALTFGLSDFIARDMLGAEYADTSTLLALLALGYFVHASLGIGVYALKILGRVRTLIVIDLVTLLVALTCCLVVIRAWGALGVVITVNLALLLNAVLAQLAVWRLEGVPPWSRAHLPAYAAVAGGVVVLGLAKLVPAGSMIVLPVLIVATCAVVLLVVRRVDRVDEMFPELARLPLVGRWLQRETEDLP